MQFATLISLPVSSRLLLLLSLLYVVNVYPDLYRDREVRVPERRPSAHTR